MEGSPHNPLLLKHALMHMRQSTILVKVKLIYTKPTLLKQSYDLPICERDFVVVSSLYVCTRCGVHQVRDLMPVTLLVCHQVTEVLLIWLELNYVCRNAQHPHFLLP